MISSNKSEMLNRVTHHVSWSQTVMFYTRTNVLLFCCKQVFAAPCWGMESGGVPRPAHHREVRGSVAPPAAVWRLSLRLGGFPPSFHPGGDDLKTRPSKDSVFTRVTHGTERRDGS